MQNNLWDHVVVDIFSVVMKILNLLSMKDIILPFSSLNRAIVLHIFILFVILPSESTLLILPFALLLEQRETV